MTRPARPGVPPAAIELLRSARRGLDEATGEKLAPARYVKAHLAALRAAAAVVAANDGGSTRRRRGPHSVWSLLPEALPGVPELAEWANYFAAGAGKREAAEAGLPGAASAQDADKHVRDAETFFSIVEATLGVQMPSELPLEPTG
jgi:hypothetical protein